MRVLTIISHTEHYTSNDGQIVGLGSTVTEINHLIEIFDEIRHIAMLHTEEAPDSAMPYTSEQIKFIPIKAVGGKTIKDKLRVAWQGPKVISTIKRVLRTSDYFQFRAPTGIGVYVIPYLTLFQTQTGWFKYAGNWKQEHKPLAYRFQKWLLENQSRPVTINGFWENQPKQCLSFENPCLTDEEIQEGQSVITSKTFRFPLELCFVGRMEPAKGVDLIIEALSQIAGENRKKIKTIHFVGAGTEMTSYQEQVEHLELPIVFHGYLSRAEVHQIYIRSHAILLPSASEGFPKVIAEAMNYGCLPVVSEVSSIGHYIKDAENGLLMTEVHASALKVCLKQLLDLEEENYKYMISNSVSFIERFSYKYYNRRLVEEVLQ